MSDSVNNSQGASMQPESSPGRSSSSQGGSPSPSVGAARPSNPQYGQYKEPEYGQLATQYPGWDPYVYGKPEPVKPKTDAHDSTTQKGATAQTGTTRRNSAATQNPFGTSSANDQNNQYNGSRQNPQGAPSFQFQRIDPNDPQQNPYYGRWDSLAIFSFVISIIGIPFLPILTGWLAMRRTKVLHTKGRGLAIAAVVIAILTVLADMYLWYMGITTADIMNFMMGLSGSTGGDGSAVSTVYAMASSFLS